MNARTILISGMGVAGPTLAYWLKGAGFEPTLIEQAPALRTSGYVIDFWGLGYDIAERMDLTTEINRAGYHVREVRIVGERGERITGFGTKVFDTLMGGRYVTIGRSDLSRLIFDSLDDEVEAIFDDEIVAMEERGDGVDVRFRRSPQRRFDLVVGADGLHSRVRELAFGPQSQYETSLGYVVAAFEAQGYRPRDDDAYLMHCHPGRMVGRFTMRDDRSLFLFVTVAPDGPPPRALEDQKALLTARYGGDGWESPQILMALAQAEELYFDNVSQIRMETWSRGRTVLLGDAAFCVSLLAGQGSALAMVSAYVLAGELASAEGRHEEAFAAYETRLRDYIQTKQAGAERFAGAFAPRTAAGLWFRNLVVSAFSIPGLSRLAIGREIIDSLRLPTYPALRPIRLRLVSSSDAGAAAG